MIPIEDVTLAWDEVILPFFEENFVEDEDVESFIGYVEKAYIGRLNHRTGQRKKPMFPAETWNIHQRILNDQPTTNNSVEAWNSRWNHTLGTGHNILRVITAFKHENSLARTKFQEQVAGQAIDPNPGQTRHRLARLEEIKYSLQNYNPLNIKEFLYDLRGDAL